METARPPESHGASERSAVHGDCIPCHPSSPRVAVIVPAYGVAHLLGEALETLQAQLWQDWEAIVVDDGAPDDVVSAFAPFSGDSRFRLLRTDNQGLATARNRAVAASTAPYIALLDGDDLYEPEYLTRMLAAIEADSGLGFVSCDAFVFGDGDHGLARYSTLYPMTRPMTLEAVLSRDVVIFVGSIIRRTALEQVGGFDGGLRSVEDLDLWIRLLTAGWRGAILPEPLARYRRRVGSLSKNARSMYEAGAVVYRKASRALEGRPEGRVADRVLASLQEKLRWQDGEDRLRRGDVAAALPLLEGAERRSPRWGLALAVIRRAPGLPAILLRAWLRMPGRRLTSRP